MIEKNKPTVYTSLCLMQIALFKFNYSELKVVFVPPFFLISTPSPDLLFIKGLCILKCCQASKLNASEH